jgi:hypothetical protein
MHEIELQIVKYGHFTPTSQPICFIAINHSKLLLANQGKVSGVRTEGPMTTYFLARVADRTCGAVQSRSTRGRP